MIKVQRNSKGFTLIELLIVIAIIGILAAIAIPAYTGYTKKAKMSGVTSAMGALKNAIIAYYTEAGSVPAATANASIGTTFGISLPNQYVSTADVSFAAGNLVTINATLQNIGEAGSVNLVSTDIATGATWRFSGSTPAIIALLPK